MHYGNQIGSITGIAFATTILYINIIPFVLQNQLGLSPSQNGEFILVSAIGLVIGAVFSSKTVKNYLPENLIQWSLNYFIFKWLRFFSWQKTYQGLIPDAILNNLSVTKRKQQWQHLIKNKLTTALILEKDDLSIGFVSICPSRDKDPIL